MFFRTVFVSVYKSLSAAMPADANLFKDLKKALEDVEKKSPSTENRKPRLARATAFGRSLPEIFIVCFGIPAG